MLAIVGGKGGCGKTTTTLGLARALADSDGQPTVVDADLAMPNVHLRTGTDRTPGLGAIREGDHPLRVAHESEDFPGVDLIPAGRGTGPVPAAALARLGGLDGQVLLDCPAGATETVASPVRAAATALVVATPDRASRVDAAKTARMVEALDTRLLGAIITRASHGHASCPSRGPLRRECDVLATVPDIEGGPERVLAASAARTAYTRLAERVSRRNI